MVQGPRPSPRDSGSAGSVQAPGARRVPRNRGGPAPTGCSVLSARPRRSLTSLCHKHSGAGLPAAAHSFPPWVLRSRAPTWPQTPSGGTIRRWAKQNPHPGDHVILYQLPSSSLTHSLTRSPPPSLIPSLPHSVPPSLSHSLICLPTHSIHLLAHSLTLSVLLQASSLPGKVLGAKVDTCKAPLVRKRPRK